VSGGDFPPRALVEIAVESADGARAAERGGADRVELCAHLAAGGLTPSLGAIETALAAVAIPIVVLVRPRAGDFVYSDAEVEAMRRDVLAARRAGAAGVAIGVLRADGAVDEARTALLADAARPATVVFHRAIDASRDPLEAIDALVRIGVDRVLTSGGAASALEGRETIAAIAKRAAGRLAVMPGAGVRSSNVSEIVAATGAREVHLSASRIERLPAPRVAMGPEAGAERRVVDEDEVRRVVAALRSGQGGPSEGR